MKRTIFFILCMYVATSLTFAQSKPVINFPASTYDFGEIAEEDGNASCNFTFTNKGDAPLVVSRVTASCGCTTPEWTKEPIAPGGSGKVTVTYAAQGRPGPFTKTITVYSNASNATVVLTIKGNVVPKKLSPAEAYPIQMGDLRLKNAWINFGQIANTDKKIQSVEIFNTGKTPMTLKFGKLPAYLTVVAVPATIPANTAGIMNVTFNASLAKIYGRLDNSFEILVNNAKANTGNKFQYSATITDDFKGVEISTAPRLGLNPTFVNFGQLSDKGTSGTQVIKISNAGPSDLIIRKIRSNTPMITISCPKTTVKSGEIIEVKLIAQPKKITTSISGILEIITNDPSNAVKEVRFAVRP